VVDRLVLGGALLASAHDVLRAGWGVAIRGGDVVEVGPNDCLVSRFPDAALLDARDLLILPGFVDAHMHAYGVLAHGMPVSGVPDSFEGFLKGFWWLQVEDRLDREMIRAAFRLTCANLIRSGVTSLCDVLEAPLIPDGALDILAEELEAAGLRAVLSVEASERHGVESGARALAENVRFVRACRGEDRLRGMISLHTSFTCSAPFVESAKDCATALGCDLHLHLSESEYEPRECAIRYGTRPVFWYDRIGVWDPTVLASQVVAVEDDEIRLLAERGVRVAHMPLSNCEVGGGIAPVPRMLECGLRPGLGSDGYITDMFQIMRGAFLLHKGAGRDPRVLPAPTVLAMAGVWGAAAIGFAGLGELKPGHPADLIGVSMEFATPLNQANVADQIVVHGDAVGVDLVVADGRVLLSGGELIREDIDRLRHCVREQAARLWQVGEHG